MNKEKHIEEMAELERLLRIRRMDIEKQGCDIWALIKKTESEEQSIANYLIGHSYRKASDVAEEIFAEIDDLLYRDERDYDDLMDSETVAEIYQEYLACSNYICGARKAIAELKKKYTQEK